MRGIRTFSTLALILALGAAAAGAAEVDDVIAKHIAARGGSNWDRIETLKATGSYTAVSVVEPFTLHRKSGNKYHLDYILLGGRSEGYDGSEAWSSRRGVPEALSGIRRSIVIREADFITPFFDYEERGYEVKFLGEVDFDGLPAIGIEVTREDEVPETWYLDPETYLDIGRSSVGTDYAGEVPRVTFHDDFREVEGVKIPFYVESQWMTRQRIMEIEDLEVNVPIDDSVFLKPLPPGMGDLANLVGTWTVTLAQRDGPDDEWQESEREATIESHLGGGMLRETYATASGADVERTLSYDRYSEKYRLTQIDSRRNLMNIQEGVLGEDGRITVSNAETGTTFSNRGTTYHARLSIFGITEDGFQLEYETSTDGGETWFLDAKATYARAE